MNTWVKKNQSITLDKNITITALLKSLGINIILKIIQRLMNELGIKSIVIKNFRPFSNKGKMGNLNN